MSLKVMPELSYIVQKNAFNTREIATLFWFVVFVFFVLRSEDVRKSLGELPKVIFQRAIIITFMLMSAYILIEVYVLWSIGLWEVAFVKDTLFWLVVVAVPLISKIINFIEKSPNIDNRKDLFSVVVLANIKWIVLFQFIVNTYTFPLLVEFISVPFLAILTLLVVFSSSQKENEQAHKILNKIQMICGILIVFFALKKFISDSHQMLSLEGFQKFFLPMYLAFLFIPFLYYFAIFLAYEKIGLRLQIGCEKDTIVKKYAKRQFFYFCKLSLKKWIILYNQYSLDVMRIKTERDVKKILVGLRKVA